MCRKALFVLLVLAAVRVSAHAQAKGSPAAIAATLTFYSTPADARAALGPPTSTTQEAGAERWSYGKSLLVFRDGHLADWSQVDRALHVDLGRPKAEAKNVVMGSTAQQVIDALGTPRSVETAFGSQCWDYPDCRLMLRDGRVSGWSERKSVSKLGYPIIHGAAAAASFRKTVSAEDLLSEYEGDSLAADKKWKDEWVTVDGELLRVLSPPVSTAPAIVTLLVQRTYLTTTEVNGKLTSGSARERVDGGIHCRFYDTSWTDLVGVEPGCRVNIRGRCKGEMTAGFSLILDDCHVESVETEKQRRERVERFQQGVTKFFRDRFPNLR